MESGVKNSETTFADLQNEIKSNYELILQKLQCLVARGGGGSSGGDNSSKLMHTDPKIRQRMNPNLGPNIGCPDSCPHSHSPFIKMASHISVVKSNQVVLKLQSFHEEKIQAREKAYEFFSPFRLRYKPKTRPCLQPILKKFTKVRDYGKYHDGDLHCFVPIPNFKKVLGFFGSDLAGKNEKVFDLLDK
ncbi:hypothetical protein C1H46_032007 [Malus baccata]|uniref:Uncharacterized protein n=1 Tax=Malus baccata TaxID=106549 RepID=A0A540L7I6_MALBA|nr:hypothetical protein C1H46_032007 [Malus baccata]